MAIGRLSLAENSDSRFMPELLKGSYGLAVLVQIDW